MKEYVYIPKGVCSNKITFKINNNIVEEILVEGGCTGNVSGLAILSKGKTVDELINLLSDIKCGVRQTSCPDQISNGLKQYKKEISLI